MKKFRQSAMMGIMAAALLFMSGMSANAGVANVNNRNGIELTDAVLALQIGAGSNYGEVNTAADVNEDGAIGSAEAIYVLQVISGVRELKQGRAVIGPLSGADVSLFRLDDTETPVYTAQTDADGYFNAPAISGAPDEYILTAVSGGVDADPNNDGTTDDATPLNGTIYGLLPLSTFNSSDFNLSAMTDIAWRYTKNLIGEVDHSGLKLRLDDLAALFISEDINGDGLVDSADIFAFSPMDPVHRDKLNFDYQLLFAENAEGDAIIKCYHNNLPDTLEALLDDYFGGYLTLFPTKDIRYGKVQAELSVFGKGAVTSNVGGIDYDPDRTDYSDNTMKTYLPRNPAEKIIFTATPDAAKEILSWNGCDSVSEDKTQCECALGTDRHVEVNFGYTETVLQPGVNLVDLTHTIVSISPDQTTIDVTANLGDTDMMDTLAGLAAGDYVVSASGGGFLRKIVSTQRVADFNYILTTENAGLDEIIAQGTGVFTKQMTHGDLAGEATGKKRSAYRNTDNPAVRLIPSDDPNDTVFQLVIGGRRTRSGCDEDDPGCVEGALTWPETDPILTITGTVEVSIEFDTGVSFCFGLPPLEYFKFVPELTATESLNVEISQAVETPEDLEIPLATIDFNPFTFYVGPVPVTVEPVLEIVMGIDAEASFEVTAGITLKQTARAGVIYNRGAGVDAFTEFIPSYEFTPPQYEAYAEVRPYIRASQSMQIYGVTGPEVSIEGFMKLTGEIGDPIIENETCIKGTDFTAAWGITAGWSWDLNKLEKLGEWAGVGEDPGGDLCTFEKDFRKWNIGGTCDELKPPFLYVENTAWIIENVEAGAGTVFSQIYIMKNLGDVPLPWEIEYKFDDVLSITPSSGEIPPTGSANVTVSVNSANIEQIPGLSYTNAFKFINLYEFHEVYEPLLPIFHSNLSRLVTVTIMPPSIASPILDAPETALNGAGEPVPSMAVLNWTYPDAMSKKYVKGYKLLQSRTPDVLDSWKIAFEVLNPDANAALLVQLTPETTYYFNVVAYDAFGRQDMASNTVQYTAPAADGAPASSGDVSAVAGDGSVTVSWNPVSGAVSYNVFMAEEPGVTKTNYLSLTGGTKYTGMTSPFEILGLANGTAYYFRVTALNATGESSESAEVSATPAETPSGDFTNSLGMTFNLIPAGTFMMGSPEDELGRYSDETQHQVTLSQDFYIMTTEVTNQQYVDFLNQIGQRGTSEEPWFDTQAEDSDSYIIGDTGNFTVESGFEDHPVIEVSWYGARAMYQWLSAQEGGNYRLPTEAEWEYAARAGTSTAFYNGGITETGCGIDPNLDQIGWYCGNANSPTHVVAQKSPNAWGLYDMSGNVYEWCQDWYGTYPSSAVTDPEGPSSGSYRVLRGGSWFSFARYCRSADRRGSSPSGRYGDFGFRLAFSPGR